MSRGIFIFEKESVVMRKWQILEFDGKPYYAFVPENDTPLEDDLIPEEMEMNYKEDLKRFPKVECVYGEDSEDTMSFDDSYYNVETEKEEDEIAKKKEEEEEDEEEEEEEEGDITTATTIDANVDFNGPIGEETNLKPIFINGIGMHENTDKSLGDLYQVKVEGSVVTLEKLEDHTQNSKDDAELKNEQRINERENSPIEEQFANGGSPQQSPRSSQSSTNTPKISRGRALKCRLCSETFGSAISFRKHVAWTHKKKVCIQEDGAYICAVCDYRTLKKSLFAAHLERKHETWSTKRSSTLVFPCAACGFVCRSKHSLQSHFIRKHTDKYEHPCKFCTRQFKVKGDLTNHVRFHHKEKPINCDVCGKLCQNSGSLYVHQKWAHYKPKFECQVCKRRMVTQENLDQHMISQHEKREKIVCAECGKTFTKKDSFKRHMSVHTGSKPHACPICTKPFARRSQLRQHLLIHTGKRPFVCDICGKAFTQKPGLICHRKTHPGTHPPLPVMPIGDIVKEFTEGYLQEKKQAAESPNNSNEDI